MTIGLDVPRPLSRVSSPHAVARHAIASADAIVDESLSAFLALRPRLFRIACRVLGSPAEAEDIVQDAWVRWQTTDRSLVRNPAAFLVTATRRLAINVRQSARARRETCVGPWLPEPVDPSADPGLEAERREALNGAVLLLLEKLSPTERAGYLLREAFNYPYCEIADILRVGEANARQLVTRARQHVSTGRRTPVKPAQHRRLISAFAAAATTGDLARLESLCASDVASAPQGGRSVRAATVGRRSEGGRQPHRPPVAVPLSCVSARRLADRQPRFTGARAATRDLLSTPG